MAASLGRGDHIGGDAPVVGEQVGWARVRVRHCAHPRRRPRSIWRIERDQTKSIPAIGIGIEKICVVVWVEVRRALGRKSTVNLRPGFLAQHRRTLKTDLAALI